MDICLNRDNLEKHKKMENLKDQISQCALCCQVNNPELYLSNPFQEYKDDPKMFPISTNYWSDAFWNLDAEVVFIGQDWGSVEYLKTYISNNRSEATNPTTSNLEKGIKEIEIEEKVFFMNAAMCLRAGQNISNNKDFDKKFLTNCRSFLFQHLQIIKPKVIVPLGAEVTKLFFNVKKFSDVVNTFHMISELEGIKIFPIYHLGTKGIYNRKRAAKSDSTGRISEDFLKDFYKIKKEL